MKVRAVTMSDRLVDITGGYGNVYKEVMKKNNLSIEAKAIYSYLSSYAGSNDIAFPSVSLICHELNISENRFRKYKDELINNGIISIKRNRTDNGFSKNIYTINHHFVSRQFVGIQNVGVQKLGIQNVGVQNEGTKNNSIKKNNYKNNREKKNSSSYDTTTAYDFLLNNFVEMQNTNKQKEVSNLVQDIKGNTLDVVKVATNYCKDNNKGLNYFIAVIKNWIADDVDTKEKALAKVTPNNKKHNKTDEVFAAMEKELNTNENKNQTIHEADNVFTFYENNGFGRLNSTIVEKIDAWREDFNGNDNIVIEALKEAINNNVYKWAYVNSILVSWYQEGINSVKDIEARKKQRNKLNNNKSFLDRLADDEEENSQYSELF
ncbi:DnaD domain protein [Staphylococcus hominis]|nr:DnaD domain protein [Staphylococcus hominis]